MHTDVDQMLRLVCPVGDIIILNFRWNFIRAKIQRSGPRRSNALVAIDAIKFDPEIRLIEPKAHGDFLDAVALALEISKPIGLRERDLA